MHSDLTNAISEILHTKSVSPILANTLLQHAASFRRTADGSDAHTVREMIIAATSFLDAEAFLVQRLWHIKNEKPSVQLCPTCKTNQCKWVQGNIHTYRSSCSPKCRSQSKEWNSKRESTLQERYGASNPAQLASSKTKRKATSLKNYGVEHPMKSKAVTDKITKFWQEIDPTIKTKMLMVRRHKNWATDFLPRILDKEWMIDQHKNQKKSQTQIASELGCDLTTVHRHLTAHGIVIDTIPMSSKGERHLLEFLQQYVECIPRDRSILNGKELDIYIPSAKLAIEYCGLYWHSEVRGKDRNYHRNKYLECKAKGIQLLTIFEDEWTESPEVVKSTVLSKIGMRSKSIYARHCTIANITTKESKKFCDRFHIQGSSNGSLHLALVENKQVVAVMILMIGKDGVYINRYCSTNVVGGFTKLLAHATMLYPAAWVHTFADLRWSNGALYEKAGFSVSSELPPDYSYSPDSQTRVHKFNFRHKYLPKLLEHYDPELSETENCDANGILRIWDCGKLKYSRPPASSQRNQVAIQ